MFYTCMKYTRFSFYLEREKLVNVIVMNLNRKFTLLVNIIFTTVFLIQISYISYSLKYPDNPNIRTYKAKFQDIDFPISFKICVAEMEKQYQRYLRNGYGSARKFFLGQSNYKSNIFGWAGHTKNLSTLGTIKG